MTKNYKVVTKKEEENKKYKDLIKEAYSRLDEAINHITYNDKFVDNNDVKLNKQIIDKLNDIIYDLETLEDAIIYKPIKVEE